MPRPRQRIASRSSRSSRCSRSTPCPTATTSAAPREAARRGETTRAARRHRRAARPATRPDDRPSARGRRRRSLVSARSSSRTQHGAWRPSVVFFPFQLTRAGHAHGKARQSLFLPGFPWDWTEIKPHARRSRRFKPYIASGISLQRAWREFRFFSRRPRKKNFK